MLSKNRKTIQSIFDEFLFLNKKEILDTKWTSIYLTDTPISEFVFYRDYGESVHFLYLYSGMSLTIPQEYMKVFFKFQSLKFEEIIEMEPETIIDKFILYMSKISRMLSRKLCNDDPLELLDTIKNVCIIGTSEFREIYSMIEFFPWRLCCMASEKEI